MKTETNLKDRRTGDRRAKPREGYGKPLDTLRFLANIAGFVGKGALENGAETIRKDA
ncbi:MAG TPA: hypothetical protein VJ873_09225 [bacterium]|nr:hypothetical protein [bacterium]